MISAKQSSGLFAGFSYFIQGLFLIFKPGVKRHVLIPFVINAIVFAGMFMFATAPVKNLFASYITHFDGWLSFLNILIDILNYLLAIFVVLLSAALLANVISSPFSAFLAAAVETHLTQREPPGSDRDLMNEFIANMLGELKKWLYYFARVIPLAILSVVLFFIFSPAIPIIWFLFGAWMFGIEYASHPMGNHGLTFPEVRNTLAQKRLLSLSFGSAVTLASSVPLLNLIIIPVAVAGATAMRVEQFPMPAETSQQLQASG